MCSSCLGQLLQSPLSHGHWLMVGQGWPWHAKNQSPNTRQRNPAFTATAPKTSSNPPFSWVGGKGQNTEAATGLGLEPKGVQTHMYRT